MYAPREQRYTRIKLQLTPRAGWLFLTTLVFIAVLVAGLSWGSQALVKAAGESAIAPVVAPQASADVSVRKFANPDPVGRGNNITYSILVKNNGPSLATNVVVSEATPLHTTFVNVFAPAGWTCITPPPGNTGTISCTVASLGVGVEDLITINVKVDASAPNGPITNTVMVSSDTSDPVPSNNSANATVTVAPLCNADLSVTKTGSPASVAPGGNITYTILVHNAGPDAAANVVLSDTIPTNTTFFSLSPAPPGWSCSTPLMGNTGTVTCTNPSLASGASAQFTLTVQVNANTTAPSVSNTATVRSDCSDSNPNNNSSTVVTTVGVQGCTADVAVRKFANPDPVGAGNNITYSLLVDNNGPDTATNVMLTESTPPHTTFLSMPTIPPGWVCTTPPVGGTGPIQCMVPTLAPSTNNFFVVNERVDPNTPAGTQISNLATIKSDCADPNQNNNTGTSTVTVNPGGPPCTTDLGVVKTSSPLNPAPNTDLTYTITVTNGTGAAFNAMLNDPLPANTTFVSLTPSGANPAGWSCTTPAVGSGGTVHCTNPNLAANSTSTFTLVVHISPNVTGGQISNTATVSSDCADTNQNNNSSTAAVTVSGGGGPADLDLFMGLAPGNTVNRGNLITYALVVTNNGPATSNTISLSDPIPANTTFDSFSVSPGWSCALSMGTFTCTRPSLANGQQEFVYLNVRVNQNAPSGPINNTATVSSATPDPNLGNNTKTGTTNVP